MVRHAGGRTVPRDERQSVTEYIPPCVGQSEPYDVLLEADFRTAPNNPNARYASGQALDICTRCEISLVCWTANREETWVQLLRLEVRRRRAAEETAAANPQPPQRRTETWTSQNSAV